MRTKVNDLLATGTSYATVLRALGDVNAALEQRDRVTTDSIRNHADRHFPVQQVARATYREILERRAKENSVDFIEGVATAITPLAVLQTITVRGYQTLVDERTTVSYRDGMEAALKLNEIARKDEGAMDRARGCWPTWAASSRWCGPSYLPNGGPTYRRPLPRRNPCIPADIARGGRGAHRAHRRRSGQGRQLMATGRRDLLGGLSTPCVGYVGTGVLHGGARLRPPMSEFASYSGLRTERGPVRWSSI